jgi:hypothetical protein
MPQLDKLAFLNEIIAVTLPLFASYYFITIYWLPNILTKLKLRSLKINLLTAESIAINLEHQTIFKYLNLSYLNIFQHMSNHFLLIKNDLEKIHTQTNLASLLTEPLSKEIKIVLNNIKLKI